MFFSFYVIPGRVAEYNQFESESYTILPMKTVGPSGALVWQRTCAPERTWRAEAV
jgi:hypothetical protein